MTNINNPLEDKRRKDWFRIDNKLVDDYGHLLTAYGIAVYAVIVRHANEETGKCFPSVSTIARKSGCSERHAARMINRLIDFNMLKRKQRWSIGGDYTSNEYTLIDKKHWKTVKECDVLTK